MSNPTNNPLGLRVGDKIARENHASLGGAIREIRTSTWRSGEGLHAAYGLNGFTNQPIRSMNTPLGHKYEIEYDVKVGDKYILEGEAYEQFGIRGQTITVTEIVGGTVLFDGPTGWGGGSKPVLGHGPTRVVRVLEESKPEPVSLPYSQLTDKAEVELSQEFDKVEVLYGGNLYINDRLFNGRDLKALGIRITKITPYVEPDLLEKAPKVDGEYVRSNSEAGYRRIFRRYNGAWTVFGIYRWGGEAPTVTTGEDANEIVREVYRTRFELVKLSTQS